MIVKKREIPLSALDDFRSFQKAVSDNQNLYTELSSRSAGPNVVSPSSNEAARNLVEEAREAFERRDLEGASDLLERALKMDDQYKDAWLMLGPLRLAQRRTNRGDNCSAQSNRPGSE